MNQKQGKKDLDEFKELIFNTCKEKKADILIYSGAVFHDGYDKVTRLLSGKTRAEEVRFFLNTYGGSGDAAFRIARALGHYYKKVNLFVHGECKSAGTLIAIGSNELIISDTGELGPLDVQIAKPDEIFARSSGLDIFQTLGVLRQEAMRSFNDYLYTINDKYRVSTKTAADMATKLVTGLLAPIYEHIDPIRIGEVQRAIEIALAYGDRLNQKSKSLQDGGLDRLISGYPDHGFVIDRKEACSIFNNVRAPEEAEDLVSSAIYEKYPTKPMLPTVVAFLLDECDTEKTTESGEKIDEQQTEHNTLFEDGKRREVGKRAFIKCDH